LVERRERSLLWFGGLSTAAVATESFTALYVIACLAFLILMSLRYSAFRGQMRWWIRSHGKSLGFAFGLPIATAVAFFFEARRRIVPMVYLLQFYWVRGESVPGFILKNLRLDLNFLAPIEIPIGATIAVVLLGGALAATYFGGAKERTFASAAAAAPALITALVISQLIVLALTRHYPFGGEARHQSILFPFIMLSVFVGLDRMLAFGPIEKYRTGLLTALGLALAVNFYRNWSQPIYFEEPYTREYEAFRASFPAARCVYTDQVSLLAYYGQTTAWKWTFAQHLREAGQGVDQYLITSPSGEHVQLLRNLDRWSFDLEKPEFYAPVRDLLRSDGRDSVTLYFVKQFPDRAGNSQPEVDEKTIRALAAGAQLKVSSILCRDRATFVTFTAG
jgi:hypothetical protein